jgi:hypothetical protein
VRYDARACVRDLADNLRVPLVGAALAEVQRGSELEPGTQQPARLYSLGSSAALVVNVFDYWRERDPAPLLRALGVAASAAATLRLEEPLPTGLPGDAPMADVTLDLVDGTRVAIESKYGEWLVRRPRNKRVFKDKYFPPDAEGVWAAAGLPKCQALAADLQSGRERLKYLHAAQLLKHALGLVKSGHERSVLVYLYYDWPAREAPTHRAELEGVAARLAGEIDLRAQTYQSLFGSLRESRGLDAGYVAYLAQRYFR